MTARTFAIGDIHGDVGHLRLLLQKLPPMSAADTLIFLGDYLDRGPASAEVVLMVRELQHTLPCQVVCLRGNHEDAWLRVIDRGWPEFLLPFGNGCVDTLRSFEGGAARSDDPPSAEEYARMERGAFFPHDVVAWMRSLLPFYEDEHAIYVHAGLLEREGVFLHPSHADASPAIFWTRSETFFREYRGKRVVVGHTKTEILPPELSSYTPADPTDLWAGPAVVAIDTGAGKGGYLTAVEFPACFVYESRTP